MIVETKVELPSTRSVLIHRPLMIEKLNKGSAFTFNKIRKLLLGNEEE